MKYIILFLFVLSSTLVFAQTNDYDLDKELEKLYIKYQMEDEQKGQVKTLLTQKYNDLLQIKELSISSKEKNLKKFELLETYDEAFVGLLNDKQKQLHKMYSQLSHPGHIQKHTNSIPGDIKNTPASKPKVKKANQ